MNYPEIDRLVSRYRDLAACRADIGRAFELLLDNFRRGGLLFTAGNGASAATAEQLAGGLLRSFQRTRKVPAEFAGRLTDDHGPAGERLAEQLQGALPAMALSSTPSFLSGVAAEQDPTVTYAQQLYALGRSGDTLLVISAGPPADNLSAALRVAGSVGLTRIVLSGREQTGLSGLADCIIRVPRVTKVEIQELHLPVCNTLSTMLEQEYFQ